MEYAIGAAIGAVMIGMVICLVAGKFALELLNYPLHKSGLATNLLVLGPLDVITISMKVAFWGGLVLSLPFLLFALEKLQRLQKIQCFEKVRLKALLCRVS